MPNLIHQKAVSEVEDALKERGIHVAGFSGVVVNQVSKEMKIGGSLIPPGKYCAVEFKAVVGPISE